MPRITPASPNACFTDWTMAGMPPATEGGGRVSNGTEASGGCARVPRGSWGSCGAAFSSAIEGASAIGSSDAAGIL
jgi:hypothetical protein